MGTARDLFRQVGWAVHGKPDAYETLCRAAELWRAEGQPFSTGMAMLRAVDAAWGRPEIMLDAHHAALRDFERVVVEQPPDTPAALAALFKLLRTPLEDRRAMTFISNAADAFRGFKSDPDTELTRDRLGIALNALAKIPVIGPDVADAARPEIGKSVRLTLEGLVRTWAHRSLGSIGDEAVLRRVLLRLLQGYIAPICTDTAWPDRIRQRHRCARRRRRSLRSLPLPSKVRGDEYAEMAGGSRSA